MLFISAQDMPRKEWQDENGEWQAEYCDIEEATIPYNEQLKMKPIWAIPCTNYKESLSSMLFTAPNYPIMLYIFDSDDYVKIDKIKHYQNIKNGDSKILPIAKDNLPDKYCEYCVNVNSIKKIIYRNFIPPIYNLYENGTNFNNIFQTNNIQIHSDIYKVLLQNVRKIPMPSREHLLKQFKNVNNAEMRTMLYVTWMIYKHTFLPIAIDSALHYKSNEQNYKDGIKIRYYFIESCTNSIYRMIKIENEFTKWSENDCSIEKYDKLYKDLEECIIDNEKCLITLFDNHIDNKIIRSKDPCPCGSGKRYKNCCGKFANLTKL